MQPMHNVYLIGIFTIHIFMSIVKNVPFSEMENGDGNQEDQNEEQSPFVPDLGLPSDESVNHGHGGVWMGGRVSF